MSDDAPLRAALRRALQLSPSPGLTDRLTDHARRVARGEAEAPPSRVPMRALAVSLALAAVLAAGAVVVVQHRTASRLSPPPSSSSTQLAIGAASPSSGLSQPTAAPTPSGAAPSAATTPSARPTATAVPIPDCQDADLTGTLYTGGSSTYTVGATVTIHETVTNRSAHACQLPSWCQFMWRALDSAGHQVGAGPGTATCAIGVPPDVLQPGASEQSPPPSAWDTSGRAPGKYTITAGLKGMARVTATITLVGATPTPTQATPTPTSLLP